MSPRQFSLSQLAIPAVSLLIAFLAYPSQYLLLYLEPGPLSRSQLVKLNVLATSIWICYYRTCTVDPGRISKDWKPTPKEADKKTEVDPGKDFTGRQRWCRKCEAFKPPRAHHCGKCQRCIPKMDHHCPWTSNCVSHFTFPHFIRFLFYAVVGLAYLESLLYARVAAVWQSRNLPSYLGPSVTQLSLLFILTVVNSLTLFALSILLIRTIISLGENVTTIESWEIERHKTLVRRARHFGGVLEGPDGIMIPIRRQEFPYDIGIWKNIKAGMGGSANILSWFWPLAATPSRDTGLEYETNGFEDPKLSWPPPDPDRIPRMIKTNDTEGPFTFQQQYSTAREEVEAFNRRRLEDIRRRQGGAELQRRKRFHERFSLDDDDEDNLSDDDYDEDDESEHQISEGEEAWKNSEGERLRDFGVDEEAEFYDEDDVPLAKLIQR
ncbi:hypothetical protein DTO217A2_938 [Paecilomyces variotii]|nr:hypothetical protein DTO217A2_938 [Paecilomyces variotii]